MANLFDYCKWRGDVPFSAVPFGEVDGLVLAELIYVYLDELQDKEMKKSLLSGEGVRIEDLSNEFFKTHEVGKTSLGVMVPGALVDLFYEMSHTVRFKDGIVYNFINKTSIEMGVQFCAMCVRFGDTLVVSYRGTDDTIVGWEENFNMGFMTPVPAQEDAKEFLEAHACDAERIIVTGHSKGGNLSAYAAIMCSDETKKKIVKAFNYDGPGFMGDFLKSDNYNAIKDRLFTIVPEESIVGMLLRHEDKYEIVESSYKGITQHDGLSWQILGPNFVKKNERSESSKLFDKSLSLWLEGMAPEERKEMVNILFTTLYATNSTTLTELMANNSKILASMHKTLDAEKRNFVFKKLMSLITTEIAGTYLEDFIKPKLDELGMEAKNGVEQMKKTMKQKEKQTKRKDTKK